MSVAVILAGAGLLDGDRPLGNGWSMPPEDFIPRNVRRRLSRLILQGLVTTFGAADPDEDTPLVFGTANGEIETIGALLPEVLRPNPVISPTLFHNSVHNAAPGYWAILARRFAAAITVSAGPATFEAALWEAVGLLRDGASQVLLTAGDEGIRTASWADPAHCTRDFCGSLLLSARIPEGRPCLGVIESLTFTPAGGDPGPRRPGERWVEDENRLPDASPHPCAALYRVLEFLSGGPGEDRMRLRRRLAGGTLFDAMISRGVGRHA